MAEDVDKLSRRRRTALALYGILFLGLQGVSFRLLDDPVSTWRTIHVVTAAAFALWSTSLIYIFATGGFPLRQRSAATRVALNDELTQANRVAGYKAGYWMMIAVALILYILSQFVELSTQEVLRLLFAIGIAMPACRFAGLERKQDA